MKQFMQVIVLGCAAFFISCSSAAPTNQTHWVETEISDPAKVAGMWGGLLMRAPNSKTDDWLRLFIYKDGRYEFRSYRTIGLLSGKGTFIVDRGKLVAQSDRGTIECTLFAADQQRMLHAVGMTTNGLEYLADLTPEK